jgi:hypothetical protein
MFWLSWHFTGMNLFILNISANPSFPSESQERLGRIVGIAEHKGDILTFLVLDSVTTQVVAGSELRSGLDSNTPKLRTIHAPDGSTSSSRKTLKSHTDSIEMDTPFRVKTTVFTRRNCLAKNFYAPLMTENAIALPLCAKYRILMLRIMPTLSFLMSLVMEHSMRYLLTALYANVFKTLRMKTIRSGLLLMSSDIKVHSERPTRTGNNISLTSSCYGKMVLKCLNNLK